MKETKKRRGRPRKVPPNPRNDSPTSRKSNHHGDSEWTSMGCPDGLKIVLKRIDVRNSALVTPAANKNLKLLSPKLSLPKIEVDSITEQNISVFAVDSRENGPSREKFITSFTESIIFRPDMQPVITRSVYSNAVEDTSCVRRRSRRILKDVKNTSTGQNTPTSRASLKNAFVQPKPAGQENVPQDAIRSHFQSLLRGINDEEPGNRSPQMLMESFIQRNETRGPVHLMTAERPSLEVALPNERGQKRKSRGKMIVSENRESPQKIACRRSPRSSSIHTRQTAAGSYVQPVEPSCPQKKNDISNFPKSPSGLQKTEISVNISSVEYHYSSVGDKTMEKAEQQSFRYTSEWNEDDSSSESNKCTASRKRPFGNFNRDNFSFSSNKRNDCVVCLDRIPKIQLSPYAPLQLPDRSTSRTYLSSDETISKPSSSYVTRNKASEIQEPVNFYQIPRKKVKKLEKLNKKSAKSNVNDNKIFKSIDIPRLPWKTVKKLENLNEKPTKSDVKENCYPAKPEVKRKNVTAKKKSSKTEPSHLYYRTRQKTAQNGDELYQMPWKKTKGFEVVPRKSNKVDIETDTDNEPPTFKGWSKPVSVTLPTISVQDAETSISKRGILKHEMPASSTPFPESSRRNVNVSFASDNDRTEVDLFSPVNSQSKTSPTIHFFNGLPMRACTVRLTCLPDPVPKSPDRSKKRMTRREARQKAESVNKCKKAHEAEAKSDPSRSPSPLKRSRRGKKRINYRCPSHSSSSSEEEQEILVDRNKQRTPYVQLRRLNAAEITSYKMTPLKEDRIPKKSKTEDDYGIDDINTDDSTDDEEYPKKCIPQWVKDHQNQPRCQSYLNTDLIHNWMKPPQFQFSLRHVFFSLKSHTFM